MKIRDRRLFFRSQLHDLYLPIYDALCAELSPEWQPYYGRRELADQARLYEMGRTLPGSIVTDAKAGESAHNYGCASDWTLWDKQGKPYWKPVDSPVWKPLEKACKLAKGEWGGTFKRQDAPHVQLGLGVRWSQVGAVYASQGYNAAMMVIRNNVA